MASLQNILDLPIDHLFSNQYFLIGLIVVTWILIKPSNQFHRSKNPIEIENKQLKGKIRFLQNGLNISEVANSKLQRDIRYWRSVAEERERKISSLEKNQKSSSLYQR